MAIEIGPGIIIGPGWTIGEGTIPPTFIVTENNDSITTETGDSLIIES